MEKVKLTEICQPKQWKTIPTSDLLEEGFPVYGANGIIGYYKEYNHNNPVIAITCRGATCGSINITVPQAYVTGNAMCLDDLRQDIDITYLYYCLLHYNFATVISGSAQPQITRQGLEKVVVSIRTLEEQKIIVSVLGRVRTLIEKRKTQLSALDEIVKARFVEMFGDPISNSKGLPTKKLGEICDLKSGDFTSADEIHDFKDDENPYPCYGGNGIRGYVNNYTHDGDFPIIGRQGALCGNVQYATGKFRNTEHAVLVTPINEINKIWLFELLTLENLYRFHTGAAQPGLAVKTLNTIDIPIADLKMQNAYAEFYKRIEKTKSTIEKALEQSQLLFDSLMQQYFG